LRWLPDHFRRQPEPEQHRKANHQRKRDHRNEL